MSKWNISEEKCFELIHLILIDILNSSGGVASLNRLVHQLNARIKKRQLSDEVHNNLFTRYLKLEHKGILDFIESYNFYGVTKDNNIISVKLYDNLIGESSKRLTKDKEWILID
jgi:hypothetical protein|tara:strand:+ start:1749 stop:2090 length:342 start_codon:yes stop_codon:yes gene_type:complete